MTFSPGRDPTARVPAALWLAVGAFLTAAMLPAKEITLPRETTFLKPAGSLGYQYASGFCANCHSADYVQHQPPAMPQEFWKAEVLKMQKAYGAPIPDSAIDPIAEYLAKTYGADRKKP